MRDLPGDARLVAEPCECGLIGCPLERKELEGHRLAQQLVGVEYGEKKLQNRILGEPHFSAVFAGCRPSNKRFARNTAHEHRIGRYRSGV
jgi:hypothetical protein